MARSLASRRPTPMNRPHWFAYYVKRHDIHVRSGDAVQAERAAQLAMFYLLLSLAEADGAL